MLVLKLKKKKKAKLNFPKKKKKSNIYKNPKLMPSFILHLNHLFPNSYFSYHSPKALNWQQLREGQAKFEAHQKGLTTNFSINKKMKIIPMILIGCGGVGRQVLHHIVSFRPLHAKQAFLRLSFQ